MGILTGTDGRVIDGADGLPIYVSESLPPYRNYGAMQARIADDLVNEAITAAHIKDAIQSAIQDHERSRFFFNEMRDDQNFSTMPGKEFYSDSDFALIGNSPHIDNLSVVAFGNRYTLHARTPQWIEEHSLNSSWRALPTDWCWTADIIRIYPVPDLAYPLIFSGTLRWPALSADQDSNPWTDEAEQLIRCRTKAILCRHISGNEELAQIMDREEARALQLLRRETTQRQAGPGRLRVRSYF